MLFFFLFLNKSFKATEVSIKSIFDDDDNLVVGFDNIDNDGDGQIDEITCDDGIIDGFLDGLFVEFQLIFDGFQD